MMTTTTTIETTSIEWGTPVESVLQFYNIDLTGKVAIVTGANSGVGLKTASAFSSVGSKVIIPCRTIKKFQQAIQYIKATLPNADFIPMELDLFNLLSIKSF